MINLNLSILLRCINALFIYSGKNIAELKVRSKALLAIIAFIGKDILVKLKSPLRIFLPISEITYFPTDLIAEINSSFRHYFPPSLQAT